MKDYNVKDLMVPLSDYATVSEQGTLGDAIMGLEKSQEEFSGKYAHRAILVYSAKDEDKIIGKLDMFDIIRSLEPRYYELGDPGAISRAGFNPQFLRSLQEQYALWRKPLRDICAKAAGLKVSKIMHEPTESEFVDEGATLDEAIHLIVMGNFQSLLVTSGQKVVGILRLTDIFDVICQITRECKI